MAQDVVEVDVLHDDQLQEGEGAVPQGHTDVGAAACLALPVRRQTADGQEPQRVPGPFTRNGRPEMSGRDQEGHSQAVSDARDV